MSERIPSGTIVKGGARIVSYRRNGGADFGAQYAMADPEEPDSRLATDEQAKQLDRDGTVTYSVVVWNTGGKDTAFSLLVGGVT